MNWFLSSTIIIVQLYCSKCRRIWFHIHVIWPFQIHSKFELIFGQVSSINKPCFLSIIHIRFRYFFIFKMSTILWRFTRKLCWLLILFRNYLGRQIWILLKVVVVCLCHKMHSHRVFGLTEEPVFNNNDLNTSGELWQTSKCQHDFFLQY